LAMSVVGTSATSRDDPPCPLIRAKAVIGGDRRRAESLLRVSDAGPAHTTRHRHGHPSEGRRPKAFSGRNRGRLGVCYGDLRAADDTPARREGDGRYGPTLQRCMREWIWTRCAVSDEDSCAIWYDREGIRRAEVLPVENRCKERTKWRRDLGAMVMMCRS